MIVRIEIDEAERDLLISALHTYGVTCTGLAHKVLEGLPGRGAVDPTATEAAAPLLRRARKASDLRGRVEGWLAVEVKP